MQYLLKRLLVCLLGVAVEIPPAQAHHSGSQYDQSRRLTIEGTVAGYDWSNPHVYIHLEEDTAQGEMVVWQVELGPPGLMRRSGWAPDTLRLGDQLTISGNPSSNEAHKSLVAASIRRGEDTLYDMMAEMARLARRDPGPTQRVDGFDGTWETLLDLPLILSFFGPEFELTQVGREALSAYDEQTMLPGLTCQPYAAPLLMIDPVVKKIETRQDVIVITGGYGSNVERIVHMDRENHNGAAPSLQGHSIGYWKRNALVIDTRHFTAHRIGSGYQGVPSGEEKHLIERLELSENGGALTYSFRLSDPEYLAAPVEGEVTWAYRPDLPFVAEPCDPSNARRFMEK